jgi:hypothetical protein
MKNIALLMLLCLSLLATSCGLLVYTYLKPVDESNVVKTLNNYTSFLLPDSNYRVSISFEARNPSISSTGGVKDFFDNYYIFYRIYLSYSPNPSPSEGDYASINTTWYSNYTSLKPMTESANNQASAVYSTFTSLQFRLVDVERDKDGNVIDATNTPLLRSAALINPLPADRLFYKSADLTNPNYAYPNLNNNADVAPIAGGTPGTVYAWAAMYVVRKSYDDTTLNENYSTPTFLGILLLPD